MEKSLMMESVQKVRSSHLSRVLLLGFLVILFQAPIAMIDDLIGEREQSGQQAVSEVAGKWGWTQSVAGPVIAVPFNAVDVEVTSDGKSISRAVTKRAYFLPKQLKVEAKAKSELRYRGIFHVPVYRASVQVQGSFQRPDFSLWQVAPQDILWDQAQIWIRITDARAIQAPTSLRWNGTELNFEAGTGDFDQGRAGIHAALRGQLTAEKLDFSFPLELNGSQGLYFAPFGDQSDIRISADWKDPSFQGAWLPTAREIGENGFEAAWAIPSLGRNYPPRWINSDTEMESSISASQVGVDFLSPINPYRMSDRSVKYQFLFLVLTFLSLWLVEVLAKVRVHPVQYLLIGAAMCLFYLLELSLAEHFGFALAYTIASSAVVGLVTGYCIGILKGLRRGAVVGGIVGLLYGYLYVLLLNQDYALLVGSIGLFIALAVVMFLTRNIDWYENS